MTQLPFDPKAPLLIFPCHIEYRRRGRAWQPLDTGASTTIIRESILRAIGYASESLTELATFGDASQSHLAPKVTLKSFSLADAKVENLEALCYTIPEEHGIHGVIGLNFLRHFNLALNFERGILTLERLRKVSIQDLPTLLPLR
jgi:predicted aspartyl protease